MCLTNWQILMLYIRQLLISRKIWVTEKSFNFFTVKKYQLTVNFRSCLFLISRSPRGYSHRNIFRQAFVVINSRGWGHSWISGRWLWRCSLRVTYFVQQFEAQPHIEVAGQDKGLVKHFICTRAFLGVFCEGNFDETAKEKRVKMRLTEMSR